MCYLSIYLLFSGTKFMTSGNWAAHKKTIIIATMARQIYNKIENKMFKQSIEKTLDDSLRILPSLLYLAMSCFSKFLRLKKHSAFSDFTPLLQAMTFRQYWYLHLILLVLLFSRCYAKLAVPFPWFHTRALNPATKWTPIGGLALV